jgi:hypothetical protein
MDVGLPAVIAHQATVDNSAAVAFGVALHRELAAGTPVDAAVAVARREVDERNECFEEWNVPVLYLAAANGVIFEHSAPSNHLGQTAGANGQPNCLRLAVRSFHHPFDSLWDGCDRLLDLAPAFDGRRIRDKKDWGETVQPKLEAFLRRHVTAQRPLELRLDAHLSIAFAAGYTLETRGIKVTLRQATLNGFTDWQSGSGETSADNTWIIETEKRKAEKDDVVLAVGVTHDNAEDVERHIKRRLKSQARLFIRAKTQRTGRGAILDGAHAFVLADTLVQDLRQRLDPQRRSRIHLFLAVPAGFAFFLGQLSHDLGRIRLYEFGYEGDRRYRRSIDLGKKAR